MIHYRPLLPLLLLIVSTGLLSSCRLFTPTKSRTAADERLVTGAPQTNITDGRVADFNPAVDYFPDKLQVRYAQQFQVEYHPNYKVVTVKPNSTFETLRFVLVQRGTPVPRGYEGARQVEVPLRTFMITNWRYTGLIETLGLQDRLLGVGTFQSVTSPAVRRLIELGKVKEINSDMGLNIEQVVSSAPDLVLTYYSNTAQGNVHPKLEEVGIKTAPLADDLESTPLGRSEWLKFFALLFNREADAEKMFTAVVGRYEALVRLAQSVEYKPKVLVNYASRDTWWIYGGRSAFARLIADAGGQYLWAENSSSSFVRLAFEAAYNRATTSECWLLGPSVSRIDIDKILTHDSRFAGIPPLAKGEVYFCARSDDAGHNLYWDQALPKPDVELADLIKIFRPQLLPDHQLVFYRKIRSASNPGAKGE